MIIPASSTLFKGRGIEPDGGGLTGVASNHAFRAGIITPSSRKSSFTRCNWSLAPVAPVEAQEALVYRRIFGPCVILADRLGEMPRHLRRFRWRQNLRITAKP